MSSSSANRLSAYQQKLDRLRDICPVRAAIDVVRGRWKPSILFHLKDGPRRFSELQAELKGITPQALTVQLRQMEADGIVSRKVYPETPLRVEYGLSDSGQQLSEVMQELEVWGGTHLQRISSAPRRKVS